MGFPTVVAATITVIRGTRNPHAPERGQVPRMSTRDELEATPGGKGSTDKAMTADLQPGSGSIGSCLPCPSSVPVHPGLGHGTIVPIVSTRETGASD